MRRYGRRCSFKATITDHRTGDILAYTQDTLDEFKDGLKQRGIKSLKLAGPVNVSRPYPKHLTLTAVEKEWLGMTVATGLGQGMVFSMGPFPKTVWVILDEPNPMAVHYQHVGSTDRMVSLRFDQCRKVSSWDKRAESLTHLQPVQFN